MVTTLSGFLKVECTIHIRKHKQNTLHYHEGYYLKRLSVAYVYIFVLYLNSVL